MAKRGRKPKPPELKILQGMRADRINPFAPAKLDGLPDPPSYLDSLGLNEWSRILPMLHALGTVGAQDGAALGLYCAAYSRFHRATDKLNGSDAAMTSETRDGGLKSSPWEGIASRAAAEMHRLLADFGLTPSARNRVVSSRPGQSDPLDDFLKSG